MARIIALSNAYEFVYSQNTIIFYAEYPSLKFYLVDYKKDQFFSEIHYNKCIELYGDCCQNMDVFSNFGENIRLFVTELKKKHNSYNSYIHCIKWNKYTIIYSEYGSTAIFLNDVMIDVMIDDDATYQFGDCSCQFLELENGDSMIINDGDVSSCILFTVNSPDISICETFDKNMENMDNTKLLALPVKCYNFLPTTNCKL